MLVIRAEIDTSGKVIQGANCPKGKMLIIVRRRDHLAARKSATSKTEVHILVKSRNLRQ